MISVIMSCYKSNQAYLKESIESILGQTYGDFEFLIANNGVDFDLKAFLGQFHDKRIKYIDNGGNIGAAVSYDKLAALSQGEYVAIQDHDDISLPHRLQVEKEALDNHPEVISVSGLIHIFGKYEKDDGVPMEPSRVKEELLFYQPIKQPTFMKRKWFCEQYKYKPNWMIYDYEFWSRTRHIPHLIVDDIVLKYRKSAGNSTKERARKIREEHARIIGGNLLSIGIYYPLLSCKALDPFNHDKVSEIELESWEQCKSHLLKHISPELYERKRIELLAKIA